MAGAIPGCVTYLQHWPQGLLRRGPREQATLLSRRRRPAGREGDAVEQDIGTVYVANLPWTTTEDELQAIFAQHVSVVDVRVIQDKETGRSRGFGFVEVRGPGAVEKAVACLNDCELNGRKLLVSPARQPRDPWADPMRGNQAPQSSQTAR